MYMLCSYKNDVLKRRDSRQNGEIMREYVIMTDGNGDLPEDYAKAEGILLVPMSFNLDGKIYGEEEQMDPKEFYAKMREGKMPTTMALNPNAFECAFRPVLEGGRDILYISFSSGLSSSYATGQVVAKQMEEEYPGSRVLVLDSLCASMGQGLLVYLTNEQKKAGKNMDETAAYVERIKGNVCHQFTVDDLMHLHRGGRVSKTTAVIGTLINVKPVLHVDDEGHLVSLFNVRGRRKALNALVDNMEKSMGKFRDQNKIVFISHGDAEEDALYVKQRVQERFGIDNFMINIICPTVGAHSGPGTVALFFLGEKR